MTKYYYMVYKTIIVNIPPNSHYIEEWKEESVFVDRHPFEFLKYIKFKILDGFNTKETNVLARMLFFKEIPEEIYNEYHDKFD